MSKLSECPVCRENTKRRWLPDFEAVGCECCGLVYKNDLGTTEELYDYYRYEYWNERTLDAERLHNRCVRLCSVVVQFSDGKPVQKHLDVGSSRGWLLDIINSIYDNEMYGVELCEYAREQCDDDIVLYETIDKVPRYPKFDLITMSHVLEHLPEPMPMLYSIWGRLRHDGIFVCEVPNFPGEPTALPPTEKSSHVLGFSQNSLRFCLEKAGFHVREIQTALPLDCPWGKRPPSYLTAICTAKRKSVVEDKRIFAQYDQETGSLGAYPIGLAADSKAK